MPKVGSTAAPRAWQLAVIVLAATIVGTLAAFVLLLLHAEASTILASAGASFATSVGIGLAIMHFMTDSA